MKKLEQVFYESYPRLWARWNDASNPTPKTIRLKIEKDFSGYAKGAAAATQPVWTKAVNSNEWEFSHLWVSVSADFLHDAPEDIGWFAHELVHAVQKYPVGFTSSWWSENTANYGRFRYFAWLSPEFLEAEPDMGIFKEEDMRDWSYEPYGKCQWFFLYLDSRYPTTKEKLGLIDSINRAIQNGEVTSDGGSAHNDPAFNAVVRRVTGFDTIELLRQQYVRELDTGTWTFHGFTN